MNFLHLDTLQQRDKSVPFTWTYKKKFTMTFSASKTTLKYAQ